MRHRSREIALPRLLETRPPARVIRLRVPVRRAAKRTGILAYRLAPYAVLLLAGFAIARRVLPHDTCCAGPDVAAKGPP